ncbi:MAG: hypothetical protein AAF682_12860 [Planctomycetota bacterium]
MPTPPTALLSLVLLGSLAAAQAPVHVVDDDGGPGADFTDLQAAVNAAASGDTVLVKEGFYGGATIDGKALRITAEADASVVLQGPLRVQSTAPAQTVFARGLTVEPGVGQPPSAVTGCAGVVWLEECVLSGPAFGFFGSQGHGLLVESSATVNLMDCALLGAESIDASGAQGLVASASLLNLYDCVLLGGPGNPGAPGGDGARLDGVTAMFSGSTATGGAGGDADGLFQPCPGEGGAGLVLTGGSTARDLGGGYAGGAGGRNGATGCTTAASGPSTDLAGGTLTSLGPQARRFDSTSPARENATSVLTFEGLEGEFCFTAYGGAPTGFFVPDWSGAFLTAAPFVFTAIGTIPAGGTLTLPINVGGLDPTFGSLVVYHQGIFFTQSFDLILGSGSSIVILDDAL